MEFDEEEVSMIKTLSDYYNSKVVGAFVWYHQKNIKYKFGENYLKWKP